MGKTTERRIVLMVGETITRANIIDGGNAIEIFSVSNCYEHSEEVKGTQEYIEKYFPIVRASTLSLKDEFLKYEPQTDNQRAFKEKLVSAIKSGLSDFRAQRMDPSSDEEENIFFHAGMLPAEEKSADWWYKTAKEFLPEKESRLGTTKERIAFLGLLIKYLIEEKRYTISGAWEAVCDQSEKLGHYWDSENAKHNYETTGNKQIGEWYDLTNTFKIIVDDEICGFSLVGGYCNGDGNYYHYPLADIYCLDNFNYDIIDSVGWLVLSV